MKKSILIALFLICLTAIRGEEVSAEDIRVQATAYCINGETATGTQTREGIIAGHPDWYGKMVIVFEDIGGEPGEVIGIYVCEDTGGEPIRNGRVIDIWMPTDGECFAFGRRNVIVRVI